MTRMRLSISKRLVTPTDYFGRIFFLHFFSLSLIYSHIYSQTNSLTLSFGGLPKILSATTDFEMFLYKKMR